ncbi:MAG: hypothetical protein FJ260_10615 [Planctomycetes bacterium]|nr:hypothetical protein [Planctomycetota bacterium]
MSKSLIAAGVAATAISFQAAAQCPDCENLSCNWFACGCVRVVGTGCSTTIDTTGGDSGVNLENSLLPSSN